MNDKLTDEEYKEAEEHRKWYYEIIRRRRVNGVEFMIFGSIILVVFLVILVLTGRYFLYIIPFGLFTGFFGLLQFILPRYIPYNLSDGDIH